MLPRIALAGLLAVVLAAASTSHRAGAELLSTGVVASVTDGDTLRLGDGRRVRLLQIDTPELGSRDCYSRAARTALLALTPLGSTIVLDTDARLDRVDRYGRLLRYVKRGTTNVNVALVRAGAAAPYFYDGERGAYASRLMAAATRARAARRGLWGACPGTVLDPTRRIETRGGANGGGGRGIIGGSGRCDPAYPGVCIPAPPPDLDCKDVPYRGFAVRSPDPHRFDGDGDGVGCEL